MSVWNPGAEESKRKIKVTRTLASRSRHLYFDHLYFDHSAGDPRLGLPRLVLAEEAIHPGICFAHGAFVYQRFAQFISMPAALSLVSSR